MRRIKPVLFVAMFLVVMNLTPFATASAQSKSLYWDRFDVYMTVLPTGELQIVERQTITFTSGTFTFGYREIPLDKTEGITNVAVSQMGVGGYSYGYSGNPYTFYTETEGGHLNIRWYFPQAANTTMTFDISYTVLGAIRIHDDGDRLQWFAIDNIRDFPIMASNVTITLPSGARFLEVDSAGARVAWEVSADEKTVTYVAQNTLSTSDVIEIGVAFTHGVIPSVKPSWQDAAEQDEFYDLKVKPWVNLGVGAIAVLLAIGGPLAVYLLWFVRGRDPKFGPVPEYLTEPPDDSPPGVLGTLVDEQADMRDIVASIVDLARRGYLTIEEVEKPGFLFTKSVDHLFRLEDKSKQDLTTFEREILRGIFPRSSRDSTLTELRNKFYKKLPTIEKELYKELVRRKLFKRRPDTVRAQWRGIAFVFIAFACVGGVVTMGLSQYTQSAICVAVALGITAVSMLLTARHMPAKTAVGAESAARWKAFKEYLTRIDKLTDIQEAGDQFERFLPYAIAFGINKSWVWKFSTLTETPAPGWYVPVGGWGHSPGTARGGVGSSGGLGDAAPASRGGLQSMSDSLSGGLQTMSDGLTQLLNSAGGALSSRPAPSGGSRGFSGGFSGGGFSGGGFSGGGGGGGGGAGFG
ncbi:MAG: DUF2207 domain-containing protein [Anaerolineales bacterium]|jgi:uncharacterized membrane protein